MGKQVAAGLKKRKHFMEAGFTRDQEFQGTEISGDW